MDAVARRRPVANSIRAEDDAESLGGEGRIEFVEGRVQRAVKPLDEPERGKRRAFPVRHEPASIEVEPPAPTGTIAGKPEQVAGGAPSS